MHFKLNCINHSLGSLPRVSPGALPWREQYLYPLSIPTTWVSMG